MTESDWKAFRNMVPRLRERYLEERNARVAATLADSTKTQTERFWDAYEKMRKEAKILQECLDGHSRSSMWLYMITMIHAGMLTKDDMTVFSTELQKEAAYAFERR